jgi:hypothetical protein
MLTMSERYVNMLRDLKDEPPETQGQVPTYGFPEWDKFIVPAGGFKRKLTPS